MPTSYFGSWFGSWFGGSGASEVAVPEVDFSGDYLVFNNLWTVNFYSRTGESTYATPLPIAHALRVTTTRTQQIGAALVTRHCVVWHLWETELGGYVPKHGDIVQDAAGVRWLIEQNHHDYLTGRFECDSFQQR